jgi:hypothetical protein
MIEIEARTPISRGRLKAKKLKRTILMFTKGSHFLCENLFAILLSI